MRSINGHVMPYDCDLYIKESIEVILQTLQENHDGYFTRMQYNMGRPF